MTMKAIFTGAAAAAGLLLSAAAAHASTQVFNFADNVDGIFAIGTLTIDDTANSNGTFDITAITGTVVDGALATPLVDQISGLVGNPSSPNPNVNFGFVYDNVTPINNNGVLFQGQSGAMYNLFTDGGSSAELYTYGLGDVPNFDAHGTLSVGGVPEPATWAMMLAGFGGLGAALRGGRRKALAAA